MNRFARHILFESFGGKSTPRRNTESLMAAAEKGHADIISHPNLYLTLDIPYLADCARQLGILLEINSSHVSLTPEEIKTIHEHGAGLSSAVTLMSAPVSVILQTESNPQNRREF